MEADVVGSNSEGPTQERDAAGVRVDEVLQSEAAWNGVPYVRYPSGVPQLTVLRFQVEPHSSLPWHHHVVPNAAYVIRGSFTVEDRDTGERRTIRAGEAFAESVDVIHRGRTEAEGADIVVTYAGVAGVELSVPAE